jgi:hypothetical protein
VYANIRGSDLPETTIHVSYDLKKLNNSLLKLI